MGKAVSNSVIIPVHMSLERKDKGKCGFDHKHHNVWAASGPYHQQQAPGCPSPSARTAGEATGSRHLTARRTCAATVGAEDRSRRRMCVAHFSWIFFYLTYIVHVNKGHKIHKNTILLCKTAFFRHNLPFSPRAVGTHSARHFRGLRFNGRISQLTFLISQ